MIEAAPPTADAVRAQVRRLIASPELARSQRLQRFLQFTVEESLASRAATLKEYTIALGVFDRDDSFDPQQSSIVRVEASRLRAKLRQYYATRGQTDPIRIDLPTGSYVPVFGWPAAEPASVAKPPARSRAAWLTRPRLAIASVTAATLIAVVGLVVGDRLGLREGISPTAAGLSSGPHAVAVLPLRNLSGDASQDYFSDGMTDALIAALAKKRMIRVISMTSVMAYRNVNRPIAEIARELDVTHVIEGSVLRIGGRIRITAQLVEAASERHLWAETYERDAANVLAIQDDVVHRIVSSLSDQAELGVAPDPGDAPTVDPEAYEAQLKARFFRNLMTEEGFNQSIEYFQRAITIEPDYALAYSCMASCYCLLGGHGFELVRPGEAMPAARATFQQALALDDTLAEPYAFPGLIKLKFDWDWQGAEEDMEPAIELSPSFSQARLLYSIFLEAMGRQNEAIGEAELARSLDPLSLAVNVNLAWQYMQADRLDDARRQLEATAELGQGFWGLHWGWGHYHRRKGKPDQAIAAFQESIAATGGHTLPLSALGHAYAVSGRSAEAREVIEALMALAAESYVSPYNVATVYAGLGEDDEVFAWLEEAYDERSRSLAWLNVAREYDRLRADPRFESLVRRIGLPQ